MSNKDFYLYIDETGVPDLSNPNPYILCGCSILRERQEILAIKANQIKFKYWGHENVHFHSIDIARDTKEFSIFKNKPDLKKEFLSDLFKFLHSAPVLINSVIIDKPEAGNQGWIQREKIISETAEYIVRNFILITHAKGKVKGRIIIESSADKDPFYLKAFNYFQSMGVPGTTLTHADVKSCLTSISFATKRNNDIETQITDLLSYGAKCKFDARKLVKGSYEERIVNVFDRKLFELPANISTHKRNILKRVKSYQVLPQKIKKRD